MMITEKIFDVLKYAVDLIYKAICLLLEMSKMIIEMALFNKYGRLITLSFLLLFWIVIIIQERQLIINYFKLYFSDMKIIRSELKNYDDVTFSLFSKSASYNLKHVLPITKERIEYYNYLMDYFTEQEEEQTTD